MIKLAEGNLILMNPEKINEKMKKNWNIFLIRENPIKVINFSFQNNKKERLKNRSFSAPIQNVKNFL